MEKPGTHHKGGENLTSREGAPYAILAMLGMVVCCGLPLLIIAAGGLASLSVITGRHELLFAGAAILVVLLAALGFAVRVRSRSRNRTRQKKADGEACCR